MGCRKTKGALAYVLTRACGFSEGILNLIYLSTDSLPGGLTLLESGKMHIRAIWGALEQGQC